MGDEASTAKGGTCGDKHRDAKTYLCDSGNTCKEKICKCCDRKHEEKRYCLSCYINLTKKRNTGSVGGGQMTKHGSVTVDPKTGQLQGWDSIF